MHAPNDRSERSARVVGISPAIRHATHNLAMGVPPPPWLGRRAHYRWYRLGRPWRRYAHWGFLFTEGCRVGDAVPGGGGEHLLRRLGAGYRSFRICPNLSLRYSHWSGGC
jgi:hypothetical protein